MPGPFRRMCLGAVVLLLAAAALPGGASAQSGAIPLDAVASEMQTERTGSVRPPDDAVVNAPMQPGVPRARDFSRSGEAGRIEALRAQGVNSDATIWTEIRQGETFTTQAPGPVTGFLVQDAGMGWQALRAKGGPLQDWTLIATGAMLGVLVLFYLLRGRIRVEHGLSGRLVERFKGIERFAHWLLAVSFLALAVTGFNMLFGKDYLMPLIGKDAFAWIAGTGKWVHNMVSWGFMLAIVMVFAIWVVHNLPQKADFLWLAKGGGLFTKGVHPPAEKFNPGQKFIFWSVIVLGGSISASGLALMFPYELPMFAKTFAVLNHLGAAEVLGEALPTDLTPIQEQQYAQVWHSIVGIAMLVIILGHIYIGSIGMQGAFAAMGSGMVDRNWAAEHHSLWLEKIEREQDGARRATGRSPTPAE